MLAFQASGSVVFAYANNVRGEATVAIWLSRAKAHMREALTDG